MLMTLVDSMYNCIDSILDSGFPQKKTIGRFVLVTFLYTDMFLYMLAEIQL